MNTNCLLRAKLLQKPPATNRDNFQLDIEAIIRSTELDERIGEEEQSRIVVDARRRRCCYKPECYSLMAGIALQAALCMIFPAPTSLNVGIACLCFFTIFYTGFISGAFLLERLSVWTLKPVTRVAMVVFTTLFNYLLLWEITKHQHSNLALFLSLAGFTFGMVFPFFLPGRIDQGQCQSPKTLFPLGQTD